MSKILQEQEVTLETIGEYLEDAGWDVGFDKDAVVMHTPRGIGFSIRFETDKHFLILGTYLPISKDFADGLALANQCNQDVFLASFSLDDDGDLCVTYVMTYERGLIVAQLARIVRRFASMLEYVIDHFDRDDVIFDFGQRSLTSPGPTPTVLQ